MKAESIPMHRAWQNENIASRAIAGRASGCRIALYSHDTMGIGHLRRNLLIAQALKAARPNASILLVAGTREAGAFDVPPGVDCLTLPSLAKGGDGSYATRHLAVGLGELIALRSRTLEAALASFEPDVLIVDKVPRGALRELEPALETLTAHCGTHCVLGLREVLDEATAVRREWDHQENDEAIRAYYDAIWVYGDPLICDQVTEYQFPPDIAAKVRYTGYFDQRQRLKSVGQSQDPLDALRLPPGRLTLCMVGGGQDGERLAEAFVQANLPPDTNGVLVTGPFMPADVQARLMRHVSLQERFRTCGFLTEPEHLLLRADAVIAMGGYNTVSEVLCYAMPALIVPRVHPRQEQLIRSERLRDLGLVDMLHPDELCPEALSRWLANEHSLWTRSLSGSSKHCSPPRRTQTRLDFNGLSKLPQLLNEILYEEPLPMCNVSQWAFGPYQPEACAGR